MADPPTDPSGEEIAAMAQRVVSGSSQWLNVAKQISDAVPFMEQTRQTAQQIADAFTSTPTGYYRPVMSQILTDLGEANRLVQSYAFPVLNPVPVAVTGSAAISSAANFSLVMLEDAAHDSRAEARHWAITFGGPVRTIAHEEANIAFVRRKLSCLSAGLATEFDQSIAEYRKCLTEISPPSSAGISLRNVLEELNGQMLILARARSSNPNLKGWANAATAIARGSPSSPQVSQLAAQQAIYDDLRNNKLTPAAKNNHSPTGPEWEAIYSEYLRLLYTVLGLIDFMDGT
jgi:hypothetical protein